MTGSAGSAEIKHFFKVWFADNGLNSIVTAFDGRLDHQAFINNGIPAGGAFTGDQDGGGGDVRGEAGVATDVNYYQADDTVANLNLTTFKANTKVIVAAVAMCAKSFKLLPPKSLARRVSLNSLACIAKSGLKV